MCLTEKARDSTISKHIDNPDCAYNYTVSCFSILDKARSAKYLRTLEAVNIILYRPSYANRKSNLSVLFNRSFDFLLVNSLELFILFSSIFFHLFTQHF